MAEILKAYIFGSVYAEGCEEEKCNADWIYIKDTIDNFYEYKRKEVKLTPVYMEGKGNYNSHKKRKEIDNLISQYSVTSKNNYSKVIYCFDCDEYNSKADDRNF